MAAEFEPIQFIDAEVEVVFDRAPTLSKKPDAPQAFIWGGTRFRIVEVLSSWHDFGRKGRESKNMQPAHLQVAARRGSWGVGRFYFRVRTEQGRVFDLYYDRAPESAANRAGHWFLLREMASA